MVDQARDAQVASANAAFDSCVAPLTTKLTITLAAGWVALVALALLLHRCTPWWKIRRRRLVPLDTGPLPDLADTLRDLVAVAGLPATPVFLVDPLDRRPGAQAFGRAGRGVVRLNAGLIGCLRTRPDTFRTVVLHELAHLRNRDVGITSLTLAFWRGFLLVALIPLLGAEIGDWFTPHHRTLWTAITTFLGEDGWRFAALALVVYVTRNSVLHTREIAADARAAQWGAGPTELSPAPDGTRLPGWARPMLDVLRPHPSWAARLSARSAGVLAPRLRPWEFFIAARTTAGRTS
jgi:Zn-dependent protease with chaperone function